MHTALPEGLRINIGAEHIGAPLVVPDTVPEGMHDIISVPLVGRDGVGELGSEYAAGAVDKHPAVKDAEGIVASAARGLGATGLLGVGEQRRGGGGRNRTPLVSLEDAKEEKPKRVAKDPDDEDKDE